MSYRQLPYLLLALCGMIAMPVYAQDRSGEAGQVQAAPAGNTALVNIERFEVTGNTLLDPALIEQVLAPFKGPNRGYSDIQYALEALEGEYRKAGYSAVHVVTPEQEITKGTITFRVIETVVGRVIIKGNKNYDKKNIRRALPALAEGYTPSARKLSENLRLANENPTRQIDVVLALGKEEDTVDAKVNVEDSSPSKFYMTEDNTGSQSTGMYRVGINYQHDNLFNRDQAMTLGYTTSPDKHLRDVTQLSASYRIPLYSLGDSLDLIASRSDTNAGSSTLVGGYTLNYRGKGNTYGVHYNHYLPRKGDYTSNVMAGLDYKAYFNNCLLSGAACAGVPDVTVFPFSLTYTGSLTKPSRLVNYAASISRNLPGHARGGQSTFNLARPGAPARYTIMRLNGSLAGALPKDWQYRVAGNVQHSSNALLTYEKFALTGATAVRGFTESEVTNDKGYVLNLEVYSPELAPKFKMENASLRLLGFIDHGHGTKVLLPGEAALDNTVGSVGLGFRYALGKIVTAQFDFAKVTQRGDSTTTKVGDHRGHISIMVNL